ncbi:hypothetical protein PLESTB_001000800 [Pleodorina starrii]|uniref:DUF6816 domain-containing protein n=1 Tax=Pleodorina starrii TaxID=330485 RepID=A0A9W6BP65_9CHLO|nr:hypothetical protein PLESTM_001206600 [Pleodorina starrii]GLC55563.1 hypothetical protein PLESTB_001000800 [Pleodorina starrii]GLC65313.1 hypothetical protein PLESTF_000279300 [Pleodorina starrii]
MQVSILDATSLTGHKPRLQAATTPRPSSWSQPTSSGRSLSHCSNKFHSAPRWRRVHSRCAQRAASGNSVDATDPAQPSTSYSSPSDAAPVTATRRSAILALAASASVPTCLSGSPGPASASKLPFLDAGWEALGGGPADLVFPEEFLGVWDVTSVLSRVETPLGEDAVPNLAAVRRAQREDLDHKTSYQVAFVRNGAGKVVYDRRFNTASMLSMYYDNTMSFTERIRWNIDDPNVLSLAMPGMSVRTRVTRRSEDLPQPDRIETSEYVESVYDSGDGGAPRIKASQCFTKYKWRSAEAAARDAGPAIVATQVVSDYLTPYDGEQQYLMAMNKPYAQYTYRMSFRRPANANVNAVIAAS